MKTPSNFIKNYQLLLMLLLILNSFTNEVTAQVQFLDSTVVTRDAFYFWKADDPKPYHYAAAINPHGNCAKVSNGYVFYTWYRGGWADRTLMVSRKKIGEGNWVHVALPAKLSLVGGKGDTHLTTNIGICPIDGTVHLMFDHHNENLNYIRSKKNIAFGPDSEFTAANFLPQQDYLIPGKVVDGVTYPDLFTNNNGEMYFERRLGAAVGGSIIMTYYNGVTWSPETTIIQGTGNQVSQGERNFAYGEAVLINGKFYYTYSVRWAESPTALNEGVYLMELGTRVDNKATNVAGKSYDLPIIDHKPFLIADPRSVPDDAGWAGGPQVAISPKNDIYLYQSPKNTTHYNYLKKAGETQFTEDRGKGGLGIFYGNRMYKFISSGEDLVISSCLAGTYNWREDFRMTVGSRFRKSIKIMDNGTIVAIYGGKENSEKISIYCYVFQIEKSEYTPQTINFDAIAQKTEGDADFTLNATATSNLPVNFISSNRNIARIVDGNKVNIVGVGTCDIIAQQAGDGTFDAAPEVTQTLVVNANISKTSQTINFTLAKTLHTWGDADQILEATATSGLPVTYESTNTEVAIIVDGKLQVKRAGKTTINALQTGDEVYNAAPIVSHEFEVPIRNQEIIFNNIPEVTSGDPVFQLQATSNNPNAKLRFVLPNNQVAIVWSDYVTQVLGAGSATITVSEEGDEYFTDAQATKTITVKPKTHILPTEIEAEYYTTKSGVNVTRWSNSIFYLNSWEVNDFAEYTVDVPSDGTYEVEVFAASPGSSKRLDVKSGTNKLATINLTVTPSLTVFKSSKASITLQKGIQKLKIVGVIGGFNFDKMKISLIQAPVIDKATLSGDSFRLQNVETGKFLKSNGVELITSDTWNAPENLWTFVKTTYNGLDYFNIDGEASGVNILRATGSGYSADPNAVITTSKTAPSSDIDKIWTIHYNEIEDTYRFEARDINTFLYVDQNGKAYNMAADITDNRSKWKAIAKSVTLGVNDEDLNPSFIKLYPNPAKNDFTIAFKDLDEVSVYIYDILGKLIYSNFTNENKLLIPNNGAFKSGIYVVKVMANNKSYFTKLVIQ
ncbi:T9SS C-terminal target domain-containing protein [Lutibacter sp. HS1-25]|uniref:BNR-4 repeat-containing protein n=1 Tax=Lutibacter sp. HS1-25 TaxID=2485000 RepID=UPI001013A43C|nr:BNR-4 repeat-containing protein [Lutibacter sp. HS1-25]RXP52965.1 T9SS C-terminal target domain-containing protein [Lutibacter sp. HS1-25]